MKQGFNLYHTVMEIIRKRGRFQLLIDIYTVLFIFTMVNREFLFFGLDIRYLQLPLGVIIIGINIISKRYHSNPSRKDDIGRSLILFYAFGLVTSLSWIFSDISPSINRLLNEVILIINVLVGSIVFYFNRNHLSYYLINYTAIFSCLILTFSIIAVHNGLTLLQISGSNEVYIYHTSSTVSHINAFGENFRCAGYASDPNYATMLLLIGIICTLKATRKNSIKIPLLILFILGICLSLSKTILLACIMCAGYILLIELVKLKTMTKIILNRVIVISIISLAFIIPLVDGVGDILPKTLQIRTVMWDYASRLFSLSPLIGSGLTSFRSFFDTRLWYVQAHSTYWQILSEFGIIGMVLYVRIAIKSLDRSVKNSYNYFLTLVFMIWIFTCESIALPFSIFIYYLSSTDSPKTQENTTTQNILFIVNSMKKGGAERVCVNLAHEAISEGKRVEFITLNKSDSNVKDSNPIIHSLNINSKNGLIKLGKMLLAVPKVNIITTAADIDMGGYNLITSHLPASNIITRLSRINMEAIYTLHLSMDHYCFCNSKVYRLIVKAFFHNRKVVAVSKGLRKELIQDYKLQPKLTKIIYNPLDPGVFDEISKMSPMPQKYILHIGRFNKQKRQDRMLQIFYSGKFYEQYDLVFCGEGEELKNIKAQAKHLKITSRVHFMPYQDDIYTWITHASVIVNTSDLEAFPMVLLEAVALNAKVVSANCNFGPNEILTGVRSYYLVSPVDDIEKYIKKINLALRKYPKTASPLIEQCKPQKIIKQYLKFYQE